ncbi:MAG TPA: GMC oxidoreductase, partial [Streptosporangiaceae bacterium]|nr:GMC oxidoreductase [Streptosporangiaceae bacterium]
AEAGLSVVLLERGRAYPPDSFPRTPAQMSRAFWDPRAGLYGMFDVWRFAGCDSVVSSGLGGGSLIYANVLLRKDEHWFVQADPLPGGGYESWPLTRTELDPHYDEVERMIGATPYPVELAPYAATPKTHAMQDAAAELGLKWQLPPLAVSFAPAPGAAPGPGLPIADPDYGNLHHRQRSTCRLCGECDIGCNIGAKNSLDFTYLSAAKHQGADLRTWHDARAIRPRPGGGYEVDYVRYDPADEGNPGGTSARPLRTIACDRLVLAAGTYGTSYLLLRNQDRFPGLSAALGTRFSGNGDLLTFLVHARDRSRTRLLDASRGPVITSAIRLSDEHDGAASGGRGAYIEDGGYPAFVDWLVEAADMPHDTRRAAHFLLERFGALMKHAPDTHLSSEISELIGAGALSVSSLPLLGMGRDVPDGVLRLRDGRLDVVWNTATSEAYFERVRTTMRRISAVLGARCVDNPMWFRKRVITVHPVGGVPMGRDPSAGVCDPYGEVFGYPGLYIADGAALPGPVGANPSLTIAALADRMCTRLLDSRPAATAAADPPGAGAAPDPGNGAGAVNGVGAGRARTGDGAAAGDGARTGPGAATGNGGARRRAGRTSLSFSEQMSGSYAAGVSNPGPVDMVSRVRQEPLAFQLTITADDVERFLDDPEHPARAEGWIDAASFGGRRPVQRGWFNLFAPAGVSDRRMMRYRLHFADGAGQPRTLSGWKNVWHGPLTHIWPDTSTLYFRLLEGHVAQGGDDGAGILGAGTLHIQIAGFARQLATFRTSGPHGTVALERFGRFFAGQLWDVYGPQRSKG